MNSLILEETKFTMSINFNAETGLCIMEGNSYPEDAINFFEPINDWVHQYIMEVNKEICLEIKLNYINSSSSKCFMDIFDTLEDYHLNGGKVIIKWLYHEDDEEIKEAGEELLEDMTFSYEFIPFND